MNHDPLSIPGPPSRTAAATPSLVFRNANVVTLHPGQPVATQVAIADGRIRWVGGPKGLGTAPAAGARVIDLGGRTVLPAFNDAHIHLLSLAATFWSVDCGPGQVRSIRDIQRLIAGQARRARTGEWVRAFGYDEAALEERRHPNRADLDDASLDVPVRLIHRSGHASVLNTAGLDRLGLRGDARDPETGYVERDPLTGHPTGFLVDMEERLAEATPRPSYELVRDGLAQASRCLVRRGIASVQDATVKNDVERWNLLQRVKADGVFAPHITFMPGINHLGAFAARGLGFGARSGGLRIGHAKIVAALANGGAQPSGDDLTRLATGARAAGYPVAIHAIEAEVVAAAVRALRDAKGGDAAWNLRDRIEHASELPGRTAARSTAIEDSGGDSAVFPVLQRRPLPCRGRPGPPVLAVPQRLPLCRRHRAARRQFRRPRSPGQPPAQHLRGHHPTVAERGATVAGGRGCAPPGGGDAYPLSRRRRSRGEGAGGHYARKGRGPGGVGQESTGLSSRRDPGHTSPHDGRRRAYCLGGWLGLVPANTPNCVVNGGLYNDNAPPLSIMELSSRRAGYRGRLYPCPRVRGQVRKRLDAPRRESDAPFVPQAGCRGRSPSRGYRGCPPVLENVGGRSGRDSGAGQDKTIRPERAPGYPRFPPVYSANPFSSTLKWPDKATGLPAKAGNPTP